MNKKYYFRSLFGLILGFVLLFGNIFSIEAKQMTNIDFNKNILNSTDGIIYDFPLPTEYIFVDDDLLLGGNFSYTVDYDEYGYQYWRTIESVSTKLMNDHYDDYSWKQKDSSYYFSPDCKTVYITVYGNLIEKGWFWDTIIPIEHTFTVCLW